MSGDDEHTTPTELAALGPLVDDVSGLPGRALFFDHLQLAIASLDRDDTVVAVLVLDIDDFKVLNDGLGPQSGDELLALVAQRLVAAMRPSDTVARLNGDDFGVICQGMSEPRDAIAVAERMLGAVRSALRVGGRDLFVTGSVGVAIAASPGASATQLVADASTAVHRAKESGGNRYELFDEALRERLLYRLELESGIRRALELDEFVLHYQPQFEVSSGRIVAVEALIRWIHPQRGQLEPAEFVPLAEKTGLIVPVGEWVLRAAARQACEWAREHDAHDLQLSVNVSARQLELAEFVDTVRDALDETGLPASQLCLEVTESAVMANVASAMRSLSAIKALGVSIAIDDFGTGFSSLGQLRDLLPLHQLKVDRSFVSAVATDEHARAIVSAVLVMAQALGLKAVAEGVENEEQLAELSALGCDFSQGFYLARPQPAEAVGRLIAERSRVA